MAKELARKRSDVVRMQRSERRKFCRAALEFARGMAQVMEECRDVVIVGIDLVPGGLVIARCDISCRQGALAGSRWPSDPCHGSTRRPIQPREQPFASHDAADFRLRRFGERESRRFNFNHPWRLLGRFLSLCCTDLLRGRSIALAGVRLLSP